MPQGHPYESTFADLGFVEKREPSYPTTSQLGLAEQDLEFLREPDVSIHLTQGDTDLV